MSNQGTSAAADEFKAKHIELVTSVEQMLSLLPPEIPRDYSIFRVPAEPRQSKEKAYTPQLVSIGPLHWGKPELIGMEEHKMRYLKAFLERTAMTTEMCLRLIWELEQRVRSCYAESIGLNSDDFVKLVLVDIGFIIESILRYHLEEEDKGVFNYVRLDLMLVENQLPFFVIDCIFDLAFNHYPLNGDQQFPPLLELLVNYFKTILLISDPDTNRLSSATVRHLADLVRMLHRPSSVRQSRASYVCVPTASALKMAGVKFQRGDNDKAFLQMEFSNNGVLKIPPICLNYSAEALLRNMIALELYLYPHDSYILDCAVFINNLIGTGEDVDILVKNGVIENYTGESQAVPDMFNRLTSQYLFHNHYFAYISSHLCSYYENPLNRGMESLRRGCCSTLFRVTSVFVATILLLLTLLQTVGTIVGLSTKDRNLSFKVTAIATAAMVVAVMVSIFFHVLLRPLTFYGKCFELLGNKGNVVPNRPVNGSV